MEERDKAEILNEAKEIITDIPANRIGGGRWVIGKLLYLILEVLLDIRTLCEQRL